VEIANRFKSASARKSEIGCWRYWRPVAELDTIWTICGPSSQVPGVGWLSGDSEPCSGRYYPFRPSFCWPLLIFSNITRTWLNNSSDNSMCYEFANAPSGSTGGDFSINCYFCRRQTGLDHLH